MPKRIAIVEDEAELASLIEYNLSRHGYQAQVLHGARGTLKSLERPPRPDPAGRHAARSRWLRVVPPDSPVLVSRPYPGVFLTARSDEVDRVLGPRNRR